MRRLLKASDVPDSANARGWKVFPAWVVSCGCHAAVLMLLAQISVAGIGGGASRGLLLGWGGGEVSTVVPSGEEAAVGLVSLPRSVGVESTEEEGAAPVATPVVSPPAISSGSAMTEGDGEGDESGSVEGSLLAHEGGGSIVGPRVKRGEGKSGGGRVSGTGTGKQGTGTGAGNRLSGGGTGEGTGAGRPQRAGFLGLNATAERVVYVIDCSASMSQNHRLEVARRELLKSVSQLDERQKFEIIFYRDKPVPMSDWDRGAGLRKVSAESQRMAGEFARGIDASGGTDHMPALRLALALRPEVVFFLTDASEPRLTEKEIREFATACRGKIHVYAIEFGLLAEAGMVPSFLKKLATQTGGDYRYFDVTRFGDEK